MRKLLLVCVVVTLPFEGRSAGSQPQATAEALEKQAGAAEEAGRMSEAFELYVRAVRALNPVPPLDIDVRIRGRLLALAPRLQAQPPAPEEAERSLVRGQVLFRDAKDEADLEKAMAELRNAVRAAPWLPELAFNLALVQEKARFYRSAAANLKLYLRTNPSDAQEVRRTIYELELRLETDKAAAHKEDCALGDVQACASIADVLLAVEAANVEDCFSKELLLTDKVMNAGTGTVRRTYQAEGCLAIANTFLTPRKRVGEPDRDANLELALKLFKRACDLGDESGCKEYARRRPVR